MDIMSAIARGKAALHRERMVFDWAKAAQLIVERNPTEASAGLQGDWGCTGGAIYRDGKPVDSDEAYAFLSSTWATPELDLDGEIIPCFKMQSEVPNWGSHTHWPDEALAILAASKAVPK